MGRDKTQLGNALLLRYVLVRKGERGEDSPKFLDRFATPCGYFRCVAGDYALIRYGMSSSKTLSISLQASAIVARFNREFGFFGSFGFDNALQVFGTSSEGSIKARLEYVESQIMRIWGKEVLQ